MMNKQINVITLVWEDNPTPIVSIWQLNHRAQDVRTEIILEIL